MRQEDYTFKGLLGLQSEFKTSLGNLARLCSKTEKNEWGWHIAQLVECLPGMKEALSSISRPEKMII